MLKFILLEVARHYLHKQENKPSNYITWFLTIVAFVTLLLASYLYFTAQENMYIGDLLILSNLLFTIAMVIKIINTCINAKRRKRMLSANSLLHGLNTLTPTIIRFLPAGAVALTGFAAMRMLHKRKN